MDQLDFGRKSHVSVSSHITRHEKMQQKSVSTPKTRLALQSSQRAKHETPGLTDVNPGVLTDRQDYFNPLKGAVYEYGTCQAR
jgi:hypothetical protein